MDQLLMVGAPDRQFQIFTGILKAGGSVEDGMTLHGVASSTVRDLHGDTMLETAIRDMEFQANQGLTIFLNHEYKVPEDVAGSTTRAVAVQRGTDSEGAPIWDLDLDIDINDANPRAVEAWKAIRKKGTKLGLSIGANIPENGYAKNDVGRYDIGHVNLLETSIVGIPANPRSWISKAVDAISDFESFQTLDGVKPEEVLEAPPADDREDFDLEADLEKGCPTCGKGASAGGCSDGYHKSEEPDTTIADEQPEAPSDPAEVEPLEGEATLVSAAIDSLDKVDGEVITVTHLQMAVEIARGLHAQTLELSRTSEEALKAKAAAERERDETIQRTDRILAGVKEVMDELKATPLGRKTNVVNAERKLAHLEGTYGAEFLKILEK